MGILSSATQILKLLMDHDRLSRKQLSQLTGMTSAGVGNAVKALIQENVVCETDRVMETEWGRPTNMLEINSEGGRVLGIAFKRDRIDFCLNNLRGQSVGWTSLPNQFSPTSPSAETAIEDLVHEVEKLLSSQVKSQLFSVGISSSGSINPARDHFIAVNSGISVEQMDHLMKAIGRRFNVPVIPEYDIDASLLAEWWLVRHAHQRPNMVYVNNQLGFSLLLNGKRIPEAMGCRRSLGWAQLERSDMPMLSDRVGCLGSSASPSSMTDRMSGFSYGHRPPVSAEKLRQEIHDLYAAYDRGDPTVVAMFERAFDDLGFVLRNLAMLFHFDIVVLEGWPPRILEEAVRRVQAVLKNGNYLFKSEQASAYPTVRTAGMGDKQQAFGTALSAMEHRLAASAKVRPGRIRRRATTETVVHHGLPSKTASFRA
ncbi:MAG: ROK family transcriptional regulator [Phycisphaerales bacterium]